MPYINLVQEQRNAAQANERKAKTYFGAFVCILTASVGAFGYFSIEAGSVTGMVGNVEAMNKKNAPMVAEIQKNTKLLNEFSPRLKTLEDARTVTDRWNRILEHLAVQTPSQTWLTGIRCVSSDPTKPIQISFLGVASGQSPIGEFIMRLQNLEDLTNTNLQFTNEKLVTNVKAIEFQVNADIAGTAEQTVKVLSEGEEEKK